MSLKTFKDFPFKKEIHFSLEKAGFREPSPIQRKAIPVILEGEDLVGQAHTGTGKTAAFALPILNRMKGDRSAETLVIVPTRELAMQVSDEFFKFSRFLSMRTATVYGGVSYRRQIERVKTSPIIVATPGRLLDLLEKKAIEISPRFVVLDEADEILSMGFIEDIRRIFQFLTAREQTLMFSATMPEEVKDLAKTLMEKPKFIRTEKGSITSPKIQQFYYIVEESERDDALVRLLETANLRKSIVFTRTKKEAERVSLILEAQGFSSRALHGDIEQYDRQKIMKDFRYGNFDILVATDLAARGLDIRGISHVINYHIPFDPESYVHRIGRTGRAKRKGVAMTLVTPHEFEELKRIREHAGSPLKFRSVPGKRLRLEDFEKEIFHIISEKKFLSKDTRVIFRKLREKYNVNEIALALIQEISSHIETGKRIGKNYDEMVALLHDSELKGEKDQKKRRKEDIPKPKLRKLGNSRIVPRKIF